MYRTGMQVNAFGRDPFPHQPPRSTSAVLTPRTAAPAPPRPPPPHRRPQRLVRGVPAFECLPSRVGQQPEVDRVQPGDLVPDAAADLQSVAVPAQHELLAV